MNQHFKTVCAGCGTTLNQCRCPSPDKQIRYGTCDNCRGAPRVHVEGDQPQNDYNALDRIGVVLSLVSFNDWQFRVGSDNEVLWLQVRCPSGKCNVTGETMNWGGRKWRLSRHMTKSEIVQTAFLAVQTAIEHEAREQFKYRGKTIFDPHYDVDKLYDLRSSPNPQDTRS